MILRRWPSFFFVLLYALTFSTATYAQKSFDDKQVEVAMRMIGHQFLQKTGDSSTRVLPITQSEGQYTISFASQFAFKPDDLVLTINGVLKETKIADTYIVEVQHCENRDVVYSYGIDSAAQLNMIPCAGRSYPIACYTIVITLKELGVSYPLTQSQVQRGISNRVLFAAGGISLLLLGVFFFIKKRKKTIPLDPNLTSIGNYQFDKRNFNLSLNGKSEELSGKEADLLQLLIKHKNETLERDTILKEVWGDEGDYIGRTLDVFISKLRKKLEGDPQIKIVNIRGVGYKLVLE